MSTNGRDKKPLPIVRRGDRVAVRRLDEILATLDADAKLDGLPFMPEMVACCGKSFRVFHRVARTCVEGIGIRAMSNTVLLDAPRCDGSAHDGCQRGCLFFWHEAWLTEAAQASPAAEDSQGDSPISVDTTIGTASSRLPTTKDDRYYCQSTELAAATRPLAPGRLRHYLHDLRMGDLTFGRFCGILWLAVKNRTWLFLRGRAYYQITGEQTKTLRAELDLQPGELVEIKSAAEIKATLNAEGLNRGLSFEPEMTLHCGRRYRVACQVSKIIAEQTGKMVNLSNTVLLEGLVCEGICSINCPRANHLYWREIWLKRV